MHVNASESFLQKNFKSRQNNMQTHLYPKINKVFKLRVRPNEEIYKDFSKLYIAMRNKKLKFDGHLSKI